MKKLRRQSLHHLACHLVFCSLMATGCAGSSTREKLDERQSQNKARAAAYAADGFTVDVHSPEPRPYRPWEFYYKNCALVSRNPYPNRSEYACSDPR